MRSWITAATLLLATATPCESAAAPGELDTTFGAFSSGMIGISDGSADHTYSSDLYVAPDGSMVVALWTDTGGRLEAHLLGLTADGEQNNAFGGDGLVSSRDTGGVLAGSTYALLAGGSDGRFLVVADRPETQDLAATLLEADGSAAAATHALSIPHAPGDVLQPYEVTRLLSGGYAITGATTSADGSTAVTWIHGLDASGEEDAAFAFQIDEGTRTYPWALRVGPDGRVYLLTIAEAGSDWISTVWRWTPSGDPDLTWGEAGHASFSFTADGAFFTQMHVLPDGRVKLFGRVDTSTAIVTQLDANGAVDTRFGDGGARTFAATESGYYDTVGYADNAVLVLAIRPDGSSWTDTSVLAFDDDGELLSEFGDAGRALFHVGTYDAPWRMQRQAGGGVVVIGETYDETESSPSFSVTALRFEGFTLDHQPDALAFDGPETNVEPGAYVTSAALTVSGLADGIKVPAVALDGEIRSGSGDWTAGVIHVGNGEQIAVRHRAAASAETETVTTLRVGGWLHENREDMVGNYREAEFRSVTRAAKASDTSDGGGGGGGAAFWLLALAACAARRRCGR